MGKGYWRGLVATLALGVGAAGAEGQGLQGGWNPGQGHPLSPQETPWKPAKKQKKESKFKPAPAKEQPISTIATANTNSSKSGHVSIEGFQLVTPRAMYVWDNTIPGDDTATAELAKFCALRNITRIFIECSPIGYGAPGAIADYDDFIITLNAEGIEVYALNGYAWFTVSPSAGLPGQPSSWTEGWTVYQNVAASGLNFKGIVDDSAPYGVQYTSNGVTYDHFWDDTQTSAQDYLDYLRGVKQRIGSLELVVTIPFWYDLDPSLLLQLDGSKKLAPLNEYVQGIVDTVNVLAYRDRALGSLGLISCVLGEIKEGPVMIGVETQDLGTLLTQSTFSEESLAQMERELFTVWLPFHKDKDFRGITIHHYGSYRDKQ